MLVLFLNTSKGFHVLDLIIKENLHKIVFGVVSYDDKKTNDDSYTKIKKICAANKIRRFVDALAYPYNYAKTNLNNKIYTIEEVEVVKDVKIENRSFGKQIFSINKCPVIVCGKGLIKLTIV